MTGLPGSTLTKTRPETCQSALSKSAIPAIRRTTDIPRSVPMIASSARFPRPGKWNIQFYPIVGNLWRNPASLTTLKTDEPITCHRL